MTIPSGPKIPRSSEISQPPMPPGVSSPSPHPQHPEHITEHSDSLGPPQDVGRPSATSYPLRPSAISTENAAAGDKPRAPLPIDQDVPAPRQSIPLDFVFTASEVSPEPEAATPSEPSGGHEPRVTTAEAHEYNDPMEPYRALGLAALHGTPVDYEPLPPHPARIEDSGTLAAERAAGTPVTEILLIEHTPQNAPLAAAAARGCNILALEGYGSYKNEDEIRSVEHTISDALSSDPAVSGPALQRMEKFQFADPFIKPLLQGMYGSDARVALIDITTLNPAHAPTIQNLTSSIAARSRAGLLPELPTTQIANILLNNLWDLAKSGPIRNANFAARLNDLRSENPDKDIRLIVGAGHYKLANQLDATHTHGLTICTPLTAGNYNDDIKHGIRRGEEIPQSLVQRATLSFIYMHTADISDVPPPHLLGQNVNNLGNLRLDDASRTRTFLIDNMTDRQVHDTLTALDDAGPVWVPPNGYIKVAAQKRQAILAEMVRRYGQQDSTIMIV